MSIEWRHQILQDNMGTRIQLSIPHHHPNHLDLCRDDLQYQHRYKRFKCDNVSLGHGNVPLTINFMKCTMYKSGLPPCGCSNDTTNQKVKDSAQTMQQRIAIF